MPTPLEAEISSLLLDYGDPMTVAEELVRRWERNLLDQAEQNDCANFLVSCGLYVRFFEQIVRLVENDHQLPWASFAEALGRGKMQLTPIEIESVFEGAKEQNDLRSLVQSKQLDIWDRRFVTERIEMLAVKATELELKKLAFKEKLEFLRNHRLTDEEAKTLREIEAFFPNDPEFEAEKAAFELRWAKEIISNSSTTTDLADDLLWKSEKLSEEQSMGRALIVARALELARENTARAYDLALAMHFMDFHGEALTVLAEAPAEPRVDWLMLEFMIRARHFVSALDQASHLELRYAGEPDTAFTVVYARARALWGLGQKSMAIDLLKSLVRIRPQYRSAHSLLMEWTADTPPSFNSGGER